MRVRIPLNRDWEFTERFDGAFLRGEPCAGTREAELPHTCAVTPYDYFDESVYQMHCGYRRRIAVPADSAQPRTLRRSMSTGGSSGSTAAAIPRSARS